MAVARSTAAPSTRRDFRSLRCRVSAAKIPLRPDRMNPIPEIVGSFGFDRHTAEFLWRADAAEAKVDRRYASIEKCL